MTQFCQWSLLIFLFTALPRNDGKPHEATRVTAGKPVGYACRGCGLRYADTPSVIKKQQKQSGLEIGDDSPSFTPYHAYGPDKGTRTCPICKYGRYQGIIYFVGNYPHWDDIKKWLTWLQQESVKRSKYLKVYFVYGNTNRYSKEARQNELQSLGEELHLNDIAVTYVPSLTDNESEVNLNRINPEVESTMVIYKDMTIIAKHIDLKPKAESFGVVSRMLDMTKN